jgi:pimeloyl-[acyl-carrier protein] methyl ester esterase
MGKSEIIFFHGWGFNGASWSTWHHDLGATVFDRGYFLRQRQLAPEDFPKIIVTHSLGLHFVPTDLFSQCQKLVIIGGFRSFHEFSERRSKSINKAMKRKLKTAPHEVLQNFYERCGLLDGLHPETNNLNVQLLMNDLDYLDSVQMDLNLLKGIPKIEILHGEMDEIVSVSHAQNLREQLTNATLRLHPTAGHALPFNCSDWCMQSLSISNFVSPGFVPNSGIPRS